MCVYIYIYLDSSGSSEQPDDRLAARDLLQAPRLLSCLAVPNIGAIITTYTILGVPYYTKSITLSKKKEGKKARAAMQNPHACRAARMQSSTFL